MTDIENLELEVRGYTFTGNIHKDRVIELVKEAKLNPLETRYALIWIWHTVYSKTYTWIAANLKEKYTRINMAGRKLAIYMASHEDFKKTLIEIKKKLMTR